jgi:hypothetical protein
MATTRALSKVAVCEYSYDGTVLRFGPDAGLFERSPDGGGRLGTQVMLQGVEQLAHSQRWGCGVWNGEVRCWGDNERGQLGFGDLNGAATPRPIQTSAKDFVQVSVAPSGQHGCALRRSGGVMCWGVNVYGQLGDHSYFDRPIPGNVKL